VVDPDRWGQTRGGARLTHLEDLQTAVIGSAQVRLGYTDRNGDVTVRTVHPLGLVTKSSVWYLIAGTDAGRRTFRVDRVTSVEPTGELVVRPAEFDLREAWDEIVATVDVLRSPAHVEAVVDPGAVDLLRWMFDRQLEVGAPGQDGRLPVTVGGQDAEVVAAQLAGLGGRVEVVAPVTARKALARVGSELRRLYGADTAGSDLG
jgi:predicted DNA-binding transcriptional regulator YafY